MHPSILPRSFARFLAAQESQQLTSSCAVQERKKTGPRGRKPSYWYNPWKIHDSLMIREGIALWLSHHKRAEKPSPCLRIIHWHPTGPKACHFSFVLYNWGLVLAQSISLHHGFVNSSLALRSITQSTPASHHRYQSIVMFFTQGILRLNVLANELPICQLPQYFKQLLSKQCTFSACMSTLLLQWVTGVHSLLPICTGLFWRQCLVLPGLKQREKKRNGKKNKWLFNQAFHKKWKYKTALLRQSISKAEYDNDERV